MKNQLCITVTHVSGSRQLSIQISVVKAIATFIAFLMLVAVVYPWWLNHLNSQLIEHNQNLKQTEQQLMASNEKLNQERIELDRLIERQQDTLALSEHQLDSLFAQINFPEAEVFDQPAKFYDARQQLAMRQAMMQIIPSGRPVEYDRVTSSFGERIHPVHNKKHKHTGIDVHARIGTPVFSTADGVVSATQNSSSGFGKLVKVNHGMGFETYYGHLNTIKVKKGQVVSKGEIIGNSGNTGRSTGPHLHYEVRYGNKPLEPAHFILMNLNNYDTQLAKIKEIPWESLTTNMQKRMLVPKPPSSPLIVTLTEPLLSTAACMSTDTCLVASSAMAP